MHITLPSLAAFLAATMFLMVATTTLPGVDQVEIENDAEILNAAIPDAAERARDLPTVLAQVADPTVAINREFLIRLALALAQDGDKGVSGFIHQGGVLHFAAVDAISPTGQSRHAQAVAMAAEAWPRKIGDAWLLTWRALRGTSLRTVPEAIARLPVNLASASLDVRSSFLGDLDPWGAFGSPALTAYLVAALDVPAEDQYAANAHSNVLRRLYETDAVAGRARILRAIQAGDETFDIRVLRLLPDESLPQFDGIFRKALHGEVNWNALCCAARYGSPALLEDVRALYQSKAGSWACELANGMLRYMVKNDRAAGLQLVREAMTMRNGTGCFSNLLPEVLSAFPGNDVDRLLEQYVLDPSEYVAREALRAMSLLPSAQARLQAILDQLGASMSAIVRENARMLLERARGDRVK